METTKEADQARQELRSQGWTLIPDDPSLRQQVTKYSVGEYVSYFDPDLRAIVVVLHSKLREALGI